MSRLYTISLPEYRIEREPDYLAVGRKLDTVIETHFQGQKIAIRGISLADHPGWSLNALVSIIRRIGTDRYDPHRKGVHHEFYKDFIIDLHAVPCTVSQRLQSSHYSGESVMAEFVSDFYGGALIDRGYSLRLDILMVYDREQLGEVDLHTLFPDEGEQAESCAFVFKRPDNKQKALLGIIKILDGYEFFS